MHVLHGSQIINHHAADVPAPSRGAPAEEQLHADHNQVAALAPPAADSGRLVRQSDVCVLQAGLARRRHLRQGEEGHWPGCDHSSSCCPLTAARLQSVKEWPKAGGATGSIRFYPEITHGANAGELAGPALCYQCSQPVLACSPRHCGTGLVEALKLLENIAEQTEDVSYADLFQFASGVAVEVGLVALHASCKGEAWHLFMLMANALAGRWRPQNPPALRAQGRRRAGVSRA